MTSITAPRQEDELALFRRDPAAWRRQHAPACARRLARYDDARLNRAWSLMSRAYQREVWRHFATAMQLRIRALRADADITGT